MDDVLQAAMRLKTARARLGWSAADVVMRLRRLSHSLDDPVRLTQQGLSRFETGKAKSIPRWMKLFDNLLEFIELPDAEQERWLRAHRARNFPAFMRDRRPVHDGTRLRETMQEQMVMMPVALPAEPVLARMFEGLLAASPRMQGAELAHELARRLPGALGLARGAIEVRERDLGDADQEDAEDRQAAQPERRRA